MMKGEERRAMREKERDEGERDEVICNLYKGACLMFGSIGRRQAEEAGKYIREHLGKFNSCTQIQEHSELLHLSSHLFPFSASLPLLRSSLYFLVFSLAFSLSFSFPLSFFTQGVEFLIDTTHLNMCVRWKLLLC